MRTGHGAVLTLLIALLALVHWSHGPALGADDHGQYLLHARALLDGAPYTEIGFLHSRYSTLVAPVAEPPGLPLLMAGVLATGSALVMRLALVACLAAAGVAVFRYWRAAEGASTGVLVAGWTAIALGGSHAFDTVLADLPFMACVWVALDLAQREGPGWRMIVAGALAFTFRMAALPLIPLAATMVLFVDRPQRRGWILATIAWAVVAAAVLVGLSAGSALGSEAVRGPATLMADLKLNLAAMLDGAREAVPYGASNRMVRWTLVGSTLVLALAGLLASVRDRKHRVLWVFVVWYALMLLALPTRAGRYLWPCIPLVAFGCVRTARALITDRRDAVRLGTGLATVVALVGVGQQALRPAPATWATDDEVRAVSAFLRTDTASRVVFFSPRVLTWETGIPSAPPFEAPADTALAFLRTHHITHVVDGDRGTGAVGQGGVAAWVRERPLDFVLVRETPAFRVFRVAPLAP